MTYSRFEIGDWRLVRIACLLAMLFIGCTAFSQTNSPADELPANLRNLGIEGHATFDLPKPDYLPLPLDSRADLILRIDKVTPLATNKFRYDIYYIGLESGAFSLANYMMRGDRSRAEELAGFKLLVKSQLPEDHNGQLNKLVPARFPFIGGYRIFLLALALAWIGGIVLFIRSYRKKRVVVAPVVVVPEPSFAERIRPLVEAAAFGNLSLEEKALLERLLMGFWREKLNLPELRMADSLVRLKEHPQAGELLRALERWLHKNSGASMSEINSLLKPYGGQSAPKTTEENRP